MFFNRALTMRWETWALLDYGDHGLGAVRRDRSRNGLLEIASTVRWVPQEGEGWEYPATSFTVLTPRNVFNRHSRGIEVRHMELGLFRIRGMSHPPGVPLQRSQAFVAEASRSGRIRTYLLEFGARYEEPADDAPDQRVTRTWQSKWWA